MHVVLSVSRALRLAVLGCALPWSGLWGQGTVARSHGIVADSAGAGLPGSEIRLVRGDSIIALVTARDGGAFSIATPSRSDRLVARRLGYARVELPWDSVTRRHDSLIIVLAPLPAQLSEFEVFASGADMDALMRDFYARRESNSFGQYFTRDDIRKSGKHHASELLRQTPGVTLSASRRFGYVVRFRGCRDAPMIWLDGNRLPGAELDDVTSSNDLAAMEVYRSPAGVPAQFLDRSNRGCGTILLWTRNR
jgi:TonB-dependent Receptor Plug Domain